MFVALREGGPRVAIRPPMNLRSFSLAAAPVITNLQRTGNSFSFTLTGVSGASYLIQRSGDMAAWTDDGTEILDAGTSKTVARTVTDGRYFFRAKAL